MLSAWKHATVVVSKAALAFVQIKQLEIVPLWLTKKQILQNQLLK